MRHDPAHVATDKEIEKIEKQIAKEYRQAHKEVSEKLEDYLSRFEKKDAKWQEWVKDGSKTEKEYIEWRKGQILVGERWKEMRDTLAQDYANASEIALSICKEHAPDVYALNHNYATFEVEKGSLLDTSYTLYSRESVERMYRDSPKLYHNYGKAVAKEIKAGKQKAWDRKRIQSVLMQGLLQGESIPKLTKRLEIVTKGDHKAAIRNARTMMTGVQNAGRIDAYDRANKMGIPVRKQWLATVDGRTRHWHRELDGVVVDNDEPFENEFGKIMFPGDPEADGANLYNCRCTLLAAIKGFELDVRDPNVRPMPKLGDMTYEEWLDGKSVSGKINASERKSGAIKGAWNAQYSGDGSKKTVDFDSKKLAQTLGSDYNDFRNTVQKSETAGMYARYADECRSYTLLESGGRYSPAADAVQFSYETHEGMSKYSTLSHEIGHMFDAKIGRADYLHYAEADLINSRCVISSGLTKAIKITPSMSDEFLGALRKDMESLKAMGSTKIKEEFLRNNAKRNATSGIQDALDGFYSTQKSRVLPWGHGDAYYNRAYNRKFKDMGIEKDLKQAMLDLGFDASNQTKVKRLTRTYEAASEAWANVASAVTCGGPELEAMEQYMPETVKVFRTIAKEF